MHERVIKFRPQNKLPSFKPIKINWGNSLYNTKLNVVLD